MSSDRLQGRALVGQSGGPSAVINQTLVGIVEEAKLHPGVTAVYGALHGVKGILEENLVDLGRESARDLERVARTPAAALGSVRKKPTKDECARIFEVLRAHDVRYFFYVGGNDSAETAQIVQSLAADAGYEIALFHVPKTIDNDLLVTDHCPGFGSAAKFVAQAVMGDDLDNRSLPGVKVDVVMGRHAGFLTAASILARRRPDDGPHLVYVPEAPFSLERFAADVEGVMKRLGRCVVAVSEGVHEEGKETILESRERDAHGNVQLSGSGALGDLLASALKARLGEKLRVRADTFGYLQRSFVGVVSETDAAEARLVGREAVRAAVAGRREGSIALRRVTGGDPAGGGYAVEAFVTPLESVARKTKSLDRAYLSPAGNDVLDAFRAYAAPIAGPLPEIGHLARHLVPKALAPR